MKRLILTRSKNLIPFASLLNQAGEPVGRILAKARLPIDCLDDPETAIPGDAVFHFRELAGRALGVDDIALDATRDLRFSSLGEFGRTLLGSPTLFSLLTTFRDHLHTQSTITKLELTRRESGDLELCYRFVQLPQVGVWHSDLYTFQWAIKIVRLVSPTWSPSRVWSLSAREEGRGKVFESTGVGKVEFGSDCTGFVIPSSMLALPLVANRLPGLQADSHGPSPEALPTTALPSTALPSTAAESLRHAIRGYSGETWLSIREAAEVFGLSARTIQRLLGEERTTYTRLMEQTRMELAGEQLEMTKIGIHEIARQLGYAHQANFTRAFGRWSGVSPREYRQQRKSG